MKSATNTVAEVWDAKYVSIHALNEECDEVSCAFGFVGIVSIHALNEECDCPLI